MATTQNLGRAKVARGNILIADANAGAIIVPNRAGATVVVGDFWIRALGGAATQCTAIELQSTDGTLVVASVAAAAATQNTIVRPETGSVTATNLNQSIGTTYEVVKGQGLRIYTTGSDETTCTSIDYWVEYIYVAA